MTAPAQPTMEELKKKYARYYQKAVTTEKLDALMDFIINDNGKGYVAAIIAGLKIFVVSAFLFARDRLVDNELRSGRQELGVDINALHNQQNEVAD